MMRGQETAPGAVARSRAGAPAVDVARRPCLLSAATYRRMLRASSAETGLGEAPNVRDRGEEDGTRMALNLPMQVNVDRSAPLNLYPLRMTSMNGEQQCQRQA